MDAGLTTTFLPSEVARLVLGYLKDQRCTKAAELFLSESVNLAEYKAMLGQGFSAPLTIGGRNLVEVLCHCDIYAATGNAGNQEKERSELWGKLDRIISQLKSFSASVAPPTMTVEVRKRPQNNKILKIIQSGIVQKDTSLEQRQAQKSGSSKKSSKKSESNKASKSPQPLVEDDSQSNHSTPTDDSTHQSLLPTVATTYESQPMPFTDYTTHVEASPSPTLTDTAATLSANQAVPVSGYNNNPAVPYTTPTSVSQMGSQAKKHVRWNLPEDAVSAAQATPNGTCYSDIQVSNLKVPRHAPEVESIMKSPLKGGGAIMNRRLFPSTTESIPMSTAGVDPVPSTHHMPVSAPYMPTAESSTTAFTGRGTDAHPQTQQENRNTVLTLPEQHWERSPHKPTTARRLQTPEKVELDQEVTELLNEIFPMRNVVEKLVQDDTWIQDLADSINLRKDEKEQLAEEKVPEVLHITKDDPIFDGFHLIVDDTNRRKGKPTKRNIMNPKPQTSVGQPDPNSQIQSSAPPQEEAFLLHDQTGIGTLPAVTLSQGVAPIHGTRSHDLTQSHGSSSLKKSVNALNKHGPLLKAKNMFTGTLTDSTIPHRIGRTKKQQRQKPARQKNLMPASTITAGLSPNKLPIPVLKHVSKESRMKPVQQNPAFASIASAYSNAAGKGEIHVPSSDHPQPIIPTMIPANATGFYFIPQDTQHSLPGQNPSAVATNLVPVSTVGAPPPSTGSNTLHPAAGSTSQLSQPTPSKAMNIEETTELLFNTGKATTATTPPQVAKVVAKTSHENSTAAESLSLAAGDPVQPPGVTHSGGKVLPLAMSSDGETSIVTAKWSPSLSKLVEKVSPQKPRRRGTSHIRHLSFSPKSTKVKRSPYRKSPSLRSPYTQGSPDIASPQLQIDLPSTPLVDGASPAAPSPGVTKPSQSLSKATRGASKGKSPTHKQISRLQSHGSALASISEGSQCADLHHFRSSPQLCVSGISSPPSVGGSVYATSPLTSPPHGLASGSCAPSPLTRDVHKSTPSGQGAQSPSVQSLRRSPRMKKSTPSMPFPGRRSVPVARKGESMANKYTPTKRGSPSIVMSGKGGCITSITVAESTPKGKNSIPTVISSPDLRRAVAVILDQGSADLLDTIEGCGEHPPYQQLTANMEVVEASGQATVIGEADAKGHLEVTDRNDISDETVGVAEALMELAGGESPVKTPFKQAAEQQVDRGSDVPPSHLSPVPLSQLTSTSTSGVKRKSRSSSTRNKRAKKEPKTKVEVNEKLKNMSVKCILDLIHK